MIAVSGAALFVLLSSLALVLMPPNAQASRAAAHLGPPSWLLAAACAVIGLGALLMTCSRSERGLETPSHMAFTSSAPSMVRRNELPTRSRSG
jgi:hypothetical protein